MGSRWRIRPSFLGGGGTDKLAVMTERDHDPPKKNFGTFNKVIDSWFKRKTHLLLPPNRLLPDMCHGKKIKVQGPQGPASSIQFRILGSQDPASSIHFRILGSQGPMSSIHCRILGFQGPTSQYTLQDPRFRRSHVRYTFQDPGFPRSHNLESPKSHKYTFQDPESPRSHDK